MGGRFWSRAAVVVALLLAIAGPVLLAGCGGGGGAGAGGGDAGGFNNSPFPNFASNGQFTNVVGLPDGNPTLAQMLRGREIVTGGLCTNCHSSTGDDPTSSMYMGGFVSGVSSQGEFKENGFISFALNLTDDTTGIVFHSPLELFLGFRTGQHHHNSGLLCEPMAYNNFTNMQDADIWSVVAYLRGLTPVSNFVSYAQDSNGNLLGLQNCNSFPEAIAPLPTYPAASEIAVTNTSGPGLPNGPATLQQVLNGRYLVTAVLQCAECHTSSGVDSPADPNWLQGVQNGTGNGVFHIAGDTISATNLTPDPTGIGNFTAQQVFDIFRLGQDPTAGTPASVFPPMPWPEYRNLTDDDIFSVVAYLQSLAPVSNAVAPPSGKVPASTFFQNLPAFPLPAYPASHEFNPAIPPPTQ